MTHDPQSAAMQHYHLHFDAAKYNTVGELLASNLNADRDESRVVDLLVAVQNAALELCGHPLHKGAWHALALQCGQNFLSVHTVDAMRDFLRRFAPDDPRIDDFDATARALLLVYDGRDQLRSAAAQANGVHGWQGNMAYELLSAVDALSYAAILLLAHEDDGYIREKLQRGLHRLSSALHEGVRHSPQPSCYAFRSIRFPDTHDV